jgi:hypothetical protein
MRRFTAVADRRDLTPMNHSSALSFTKASPVLADASLSSTMVPCLA